MATTLDRARDVDLPPSFRNSNSKARSGYPTGNVRDPLAVRQYATYTRALWDEQDEYMAGLHRVWTQNLLFLSGRQWWLPQRNPAEPFRPPRVPSWKEQPVTNLTMAFFRTYLAKVLKNRPAWTVIPATTEPDDIHAAELGDQVLEAKWQELKLARVLRAAVSWALTTGNGYLYPYWNSNTGRMVPAEAVLDVPVYDEMGAVTGTEEMPVLLDKKGEPQLLANGRPDPAAEPVMVDEGDVGVKAYAPEQVRVNPEAESDDDLNWVIISEIRSLRELALTHPDLVQSGKLIPEDVTIADLDRALTSLDGLLSPTTTQVRDTRDEQLDRVLVLHYHEKPSEEYPNGRYWQATRDLLLEDPQDLPEGIWPPIIHLQDVAIPGRYHAGSVLEQIVPINKSYNELNAQIREHHNLMAKGKWLVPRGSGIRQGMISNAPGEVIQFNPGFQPEQAKIVPLPQTILDERQRIYGDFEIVGGIHGISMGKAPPGVSAGVAFLQLQEADDTDLNPFLTMLEDRVAELAGAVLQIIKARYTTERLIYVTGQNQRYQVRSFKGSDLRGAVDVRPQAGSSFPWSKTAQQSMMLTLAAQLPQLFTNPETGQFDTAKFARLLPVGGLGALGLDSDLDVQEAQREEEQFSVLGLEGNEMPEVGFWQNHDIHYLSHIRVLKSAKFKDWPMQGQRAFLAHVQQTLQQRDQKAAQMAQMNAMAQGNAPKELYQQGGPAGMDGAGAPGTPTGAAPGEFPGQGGPLDFASMPPELMGMAGTGSPDWLQGAMGGGTMP